jgi:hypothetical protein
MTTLPIPHAFSRAAFALLLVISASAGQAEQISVRLDTATLSGRGWLDLQFNPGPGATPAASAVLSGFRGALDGVAGIDGDVAGTLPGVLVMSNGTPYNALFQPVVLGGPFSFVLDFCSEVDATGFESGSVFAVSLYGADGVTALGSPDPSTNALVTIDLQLARIAWPGGMAVTVNDPVLASASAMPATAVPVPGSLPLILLGAAALRARRHRPRADPRVC